MMCISEQAHYWSRSSCWESWPAAYRKQEGQPEDILPESRIHPPNFQQSVVVIKIPTTTQINSLPCLDLVM